MHCINIKGFGIVFKQSANSGEIDQAENRRTRRKMFLVNFSGGIDSANCTYNLLKEGCPLLVHHCIYHNRMHRGDEEKKATDSILKWFKDKGLDKFQYIESEISVSNFRYRLSDIELMGVLSAGLARVRRNNISTIVINESLDDFRQSDFHIRHESRLSLIKTLCAPYGHVGIMAPNKNRSRVDVIKDTPIELLKMCWYCRNPQDGIRCARCKTCVKTIPVLIELGLEQNRGGPVH